MGKFCFLASVVLFVFFHGFLCSPLKVHGDEEDLLNNIFQNIRSFIEDVDFDNTQLNKTDPKTMFHINRITELPGGIQKIEKFVPNESEGDDVNRSEVEEYIKFPNHTIRHGNKEEIECVDTMDCNTTSYCGKLSYTCHSCHSKSESCQSSEECCPGLNCDGASNICKGFKGHSGDKCSTSADCNEQFCCVLGDDGDGVCQPYLKEGENCGRDPFPDMFSLDNSFVQEAVTGLPNRCSCGKGLQCQKQQTFLFMATEVCSRVKAKKSRRRKPSPSYHYHSVEDEKKLPLPDLFTNSLSEKSHTMSAKKNKHFTTTKRTTMPFALTDVINLFANMNTEHEIENQKDDDDGDMKEEKKRDIEEVNERAREAAHDVIDGLFDNIAKGYMRTKN